jgi:hypothetical protein
MKKMYRVVVHYEGAIAFDIEAENEEKAEQLADVYIGDIDDREFIANLCEIGVCDCYEVN